MFPYIRQQYESLNRNDIRWKGRYDYTYPLFFSFQFKDIAGESGIAGRKREKGICCSYRLLTVLIFFPANTCNGGSKFCLKLSV